MGLKSRCFKVQIISEEGLQTQFVESNSFVFGRSSEADLQLQSPKLSRMHLRVWIEGAEVFIADQKSSLGTTLNGKPLQAGKAYRYRTCDTIQLGGYYGFITLTVLPEFERSLLIKRNDKKFVERTVKTGFGDHLSDWLRKTVSSTAEQALVEEEQAILAERIEEEEKFQRKIEQMFHQASATIKRIEESAKSNIENLLQQAKTVADNKLQNEHDKIHAEIQGLRTKELEKLNSELDQIKAREIQKSEAEAKNIRQQALDEKLRITESATLEKEQMKLAIEEKAKLYYREVIEKATQEGEQYKNNVKSQHASLIESANLSANQIVEKANLQAIEVTRAADVKAKQILEEAQTHVEELNNIREKLNLDISELRSGKDQLTRKVTEDAKKQEEDTKQKIERMLAEANETVKIRLEDAAAESDANISEAEQKAARIIADSRAKAESQVNALIAGGNDQYEKLKKTLLTLEARKEQLEKSLIGMEETENLLKIKQGELDRLKIQLDVLKSEHDKTKKEKDLELDKLIKEVHRLDVEHNRLDKLNRQLSSENSDFEQNIKKLTAEYDQEKLKSGQLIKLAETKMTEVDVTIAKMLQKAQSEFDEITSGAKTQAKQLIDSTEKDLATKRVREMELIKEEALKERKQNEKLKSAQSAALIRLLKQEILLRMENFRTQATTPELAPMNREIERVITMVMNNESPQLEDAMKNFESYNPQSTENTRLYWRRAFAGAAAVFLLSILINMNWKNIKKFAVEKMQDEKSITAQDLYVQKVHQMRAERPQFNPEKTPDLKESYTRNVIYTTSFVEHSLADDYQKKWILALNEFFVTKLGLNENRIGPFVTKEVSLIRRLDELRQNINPQFVDSKIKEMEELEGIRLPALIDAVGGNKRWVKFLKFKKNFFETYQPDSLEESESINPSERIPTTEDKPGTDP